MYCVISAAAAVLIFLLRLLRVALGRPPAAFARAALARAVVIVRRGAVTARSISALVPESGDRY